MRIIGNIIHQRYKITILEMNQRLSLQIEDGDLQQTYRFRGMDVKDIHKMCSKAFLESVDGTFDLMRHTKKESLQQHIISDTDFPEII